MSAIIKIIAGAALIVASFFVPPFLAFLTPLFFGAGTALELGAVSQLLQKGPQYQTLQQRLANQLITFRYPTYPKQLLFGRLRTGGVVTFEGAGSPSSNLVYLVITISGNQIQSIDKMYFDGLPVALDGNGNSTGMWNTHDITGNVHVEFNLGADNQNAFPGLVSALPGEWTSAHQQCGCAGVYLKIHLDPAKFAAGVPNITFDVHGSNQIYDPRTSTTGYSENPALIIAWYLSNTRYGMKMNYTTKLNQTNLIAAANICDTSVNLAGLVQGLTINHAGSGYTVGTVVDVLAGNNNASATVMDVDGDGGVIRLNLGANGSGYSNATNVSTAIVSGNGAGLTVDVTAMSGTEATYSCNGVIDTSQTRGSIMAEICAAMAGGFSYIGGQIFLFPGCWQSPSVTLSEADLRGPITVQKSSRRDLFNSVKGTYVCPANNWQAADFPPYTDSGYLAADGGFYSWKDVQLAFVISPSTAQRLARIELNDARRQWTANLPCRITGYLCEPGDVINLNYARFGWVNKTFRVIKVDFTQDESGASESPMPVCDLTVKETDANIYGWSTSYELAQPMPAPANKLSAIPVLAGSGTYQGSVNPVSQSGAGTAILVAASLWIFPVPSGNITVSYNAGSVDPGSYGTWIVYCVDPSLQGGAVTYYATQNASDLCTQPGIIPIGVITTSAQAITSQDDVNGSGTANPVTTSSFTRALTNPSLIVVGVVNQNGTTISTPTDTAGNTYVDCGAGKVLYNGSTRALQLFYALNTHTTPNNVISVANAGGNILQVQAREFLSMATASPIDGYATHTGNSIVEQNGAWTGLITPTSNMDVVIGFTSPCGDTIGVGFIGNMLYPALEYTILPIAESIQATWNCSLAVAYGAIIAAFKPAGGATTPGIGTGMGNPGSRPPNPGKTWSWN